MIGHSIGELVAACIAECFSLEDALRVVAERGRLMQAQPAGAMLAVLLPESDVRGLMGDGLDLAAVNAEAQCVVAGEFAAIDELEDRLKAAGISCARLQTSHAFHSRMMDPAVDAFRTFLERIPIAPPQARWVSTLTGTWIDRDDATSPAYWARHLREAVRFVDGVRVLLTETTGTLLEVGPGETLSRLARRAAGTVTERRSVATMPGAAGTAPDSDVLLGALARLWVTGVDIDWPGVHTHARRWRVRLPTYPFERQRFWVSVPDEGEEDALAASTLKNADMADWFYTPSWKYSVAPEAHPLPDAACWVVFEDESGVGAEIVRRLTDQGQNVVIVRSGSEFRRGDDRTYEIDPRDRDHYTELFRDLRAGGLTPDHIVHLWSITGRRPLECSPESVGAMMDTGFYSALAVAQALAALNVTTPVRLDVLSDQMHMISGEEAVNVAVSPVTGVCRSVPQEYGNIRCRSIDMVLTDAEPARRSLIDRLYAEVTSDRLDPTIAYRGGQRWIQVFEPDRFEEPPPHDSLLRDGGVYLLTGGLGRIPLVLANELATTLGARLALVSRSRFPPRGEWKRHLATHGPDDTTSQRIRQLEEIEALGVDFMVLRADVSDEAALRQAIDRVYVRYGVIHGVIHGAGDVSAAGFFGIDQADRARCERQFDAKVRGLLTLERVLKGETLDFWLLLSSISSVLAGLGYVAYSAANAFMDAYAAERSATTGVPWLSVDWDTWDFTEGAEFDPAHPVILAQEGAECLRRLAAWTTPSRVVVSVNDLYTRVDQWINLTPAAGGGDPTGQLHARPTTDTGYVAPRNEMEQRIAAVWQELLGVSQVGIHDDFFVELSGSSLLATQLVTRLRNQFNTELPLRRFFEAPTVADLAALIASEASVSGQSAHTGSRG